MTQKTLGEMIRAGRRSLKMTQGELAQNVGLDQSHISKLESGGSGVSTDKLVAIARVLRLNLDDVVTQEKGIMRNSRAARDPRQDILCNPSAPEGLREFMADEDVLRILKASRDELLLLVDIDLPPVVTKDGYIQLFYTLRSITQCQRHWRDKNVTPPSPDES